jgi:hypothetical protein
MFVKTQNGVPRMSRLAYCLPLSMCYPNLALGCPFCNSDTGLKVKAAIFGGDFLTNAAAVALPVPLLLACVVLVYFGWPSALRPE